MAKAGKDQKVFFRSDTTAPTGTDEIDGMAEFSVSEPVDMEETTDFKDGGGWKTRIPLLKDFSIDVSGHSESGDTVQALIRTHKGNGAVAYCTIHFDPAASGGSKGFRFPVLVEDISTSGSVTGAGKVAYKFTGNGAPVAV